MYEKLNVKIEGLVPCLMHNGQTSDPLNLFSKEIKKISSKRKKTEEDHEALARLEWMASLYLDEDQRISWPGENLESMLIAAAKKHRMGPAAKTLLCPDIYPLSFEHQHLDPSSIYELDQYVNRSRVRVQQSAVMRTRPIFPEWSLQFEIHHQPDVLGVDQIRMLLDTAGNLIGLSDWRPKFGRFVLTSVE